MQPILPKHLFMPSKEKISGTTEKENCKKNQNHQIMSDSYKILVVDDEKDLCEILQFNLASEGFDIEVAYSGEEALNKSIEGFDLLLLDVMMGGMSGFKLADKIRKEMGLSVPIIFLTARETENDMLTGFNIGADDYLSKPFSIKELVARIKAVLRRGKNVEVKPKVITIDNMELDLNRKSVTIENEQILLTRKEFEILTMLITHKGKYLSRQEIMDRIWSDDVIVTERNVDSVTITSSLQIRSIISCRLRYFPLCVISMVKISNSLRVSKICSFSMVTDFRFKSSSMLSIVITFGLTSTFLPLRRTAFIRATSSLIEKGFDR